MNSQTVAERVTGMPGTWEEDQPLYAQVAKAQGMAINDMDPREIQNIPSLAERLRSAGKQQHSRR